MKPVTSSTKPSRWVRALGAFLVGSALALVFTSYLQPGLMHTLALLVWNCF